MLFGIENLQKKNPIKKELIAPQKHIIQRKSRTSARTITLCANRNTSVDI